MSTASSAREGRLPQRAELLAVIGRATDVGMGVPPDLSLDTAAIAGRLADAAGLSAADKTDAWRVAILRYAGCTADADVSHGAMGDEVEVRGRGYAVDWGEPSDVLRFLWSELAADLPFPRRVGFVVARLVRMPALFKTAQSHCEVNELMALSLGLSEASRRALAHAFERWDGRGWPAGVRAERAALPARVASVAAMVAAAHRLGGQDAVVETLRRRRGRATDPSLTDLALTKLPALCHGLEQPWAAALAEAGDEHRPATEGELDAALEALAAFADLKAQHTRGHSARVAHTTAAAARLLRLPPEACERARRAGLVHDLGRVGVSAGVWDKAGPLTDDERERVRTHTLLTERILRQPEALAPVAELAALAHERLDASGYHRRLPPDALGAAARVLAAADVWCALGEARAWRPALGREEATERLREQARAGALCGEAVEAVLASAGVRPRFEAELPGGLTPREAEVLRLVARGLTNKEIGVALGISTRTAGHHLEHAFAKIGVTTRAAAATYAMHRRLLA